MDDVAKLRAEFDVMVSSMQRQLNFHANDMFNLFLGKLKQATENNRARASQVEIGIQTEPELAIPQQKHLNTTELELFPGQRTDPQSTTSRPDAPILSSSAREIIPNIDHEIIIIKPELEDGHIENPIADEELSDDDFTDDFSSCDCTDCVKVEDISDHDSTPLFNLFNEESTLGSLEGSQSSIPGNSVEQSECSSSSSLARVKRKRDSVNHNISSNTASASISNSIHHMDHTMKVNIKKSNDCKKKKRDNYEADQTKYFIVRGLDCFVDGCDLTFSNLSLLDQHLLCDHAIQQYRCILAGCGQSFEQSFQLWNHISHIHPRANFTCHLCGTKLKNYQILLMHFTHRHCQGIFQCLAENCHFVGSTRQAAANHYIYAHGEFVCSFEGCHKTFVTEGRLKIHRRKHSGLRPFRCKWPGCGQAFAQSNNARTHIRSVHFKLPDTKKQQLEMGIVDFRDPKEFIEVLSDFL